MKIIKRRITSVRSTQQIMKAMDLVATSKLQKSKQRLETIRPLYNETKRVMDGVRGGSETSGNVFVKQREVKNTAYLLITSDRGLCGAYNTNVCRELFSFLTNAESAEQIFTAGTKGFDFLKRRSRNIVERYVGVSETAFYEDAERIGKQLIALYESGEVDEVYVAYTHFESMMAYEPKIVKILPVGGDSENEADKPRNMEYEPDADTFLQNAVPLYVSVFIYGAMAESSVCEQAARMTSMNAASKNAGDIIDDLTLTFNRIRQGQITQEINEIVSGANALQ
jgi:F-type H+-transporting ATPase subunit gamma